MYKMNYVLLTCTRYLQDLIQKLLERSVANRWLWPQICSGLRRLNPLPSIFAPKGAKNGSQALDFEKLQTVFEPMASLNGSSGPVMTKKRLREESRAEFEAVDQSLGS